MRLRGAFLAFAVGAVTVLLLGTSALAGLRAPEATAELAASLAEDEAVRSVVTEALVDALLEETAGLDDAVGVLLPFIRPLVEQAASAAVDSEPGRAALASALTDALRQLTFSGPIVIDLRAAVLVAVESVPAPLDSIARMAVERGSVGVIVIGETPDDPADIASAPPSDDELRQVAGLPARITMVALGLLLVMLIILLVGRDPDARARRLALAGVPLVVLGASTAALIRSAPAVVVDRLAGVATDDATPFIDVLPLLTQGLAGLLAPTTTLAAALAVTGVGLIAAAARSALARRDGVAAGTSMRDGSFAN